MLPVRSTVAVEVWGPEPIGAGQALRMFRACRQQARGFKPAMNGDPTVSYAGDLGPLQSFTRLRVSGARGTTRRGNTQALPGTNPGSSAQAVLGAAGI